MDPRKEFRNIVGNNIFVATHIKKDGEVRKMKARAGVKKHLKGGESTIAHKENLFSCFDLDKGEYRCINIDTLIELKCGEFHMKLVDGVWVYA